MRGKLIAKNRTEIMCSNSKEKEFIEQLKFIGATPEKVTSRNTYFVFDGDVTTTMRYLGL